MIFEKLLCGWFHSVVSVYVQGGNVLFNLCKAFENDSKMYNGGHSRCLLKDGGMKCLQSLYFDHRLPNKSFQSLGSLRKQTIY